MQWSFYKSENHFPFVFFSKMDPLIFFFFFFVFLLLSAAKIYYLKVNHLLNFCGDMNPAVWISFLTNLWLENKSSFFSFSTFVICVLYMPLDPFINYSCLLRSDIFGLLTLNRFLSLSSQDRNLKQDRKAFFTSFYYGTFITY